MRSSLQRSLIALTSSAVVMTACSSGEPAAPAQCAVSAVAVAPPSGSIEIGATTTLSASITQQNCSGLTTTWSSSNTAVATISATGEVLGVSAGTSTITATVSGRTATTNVTVVPAAVATITLAAPYSNLTVGVQNTVAATVKDARGATLTGRTVTWASSNSAVATVSTAGVVQGVTLGGPVTITATSEGKSATVQISVVPRYAYVFANVANPTAPYDGNASSSYSSVGAPSTITRTGPGDYTVRFRNMASGTQPTAVLASAFGFGNSTCKTIRWVDDASDIVATIACRDVADVGTDLQFFVSLYGADAFPGRFGFAWAEQAGATAAYAPHPAYAHNAAAQPISVTRTALGSYTVRFTGNGRASLTNPAETFHVMSYGAGSARCEVLNWSASTADVNVRCTDAPGTPVDSRFVIVMLEQGRPSMRHALAWAHCGAVSCTPTTNYARSTGGAISVNRVSNGVYDVVFAGLRRVSGTDHVLVTSYGGGGGFCKLVSVDNTGTEDLTAKVQCFGPGAALSDRMFDIAVVP